MNVTLTMEDVIILARTPGVHFIAHVTNLTHLRPTGRHVLKVVMAML